MKNLRNIFTLLILTALIAMTGCKAQQQMQQQITDLELKVADNQKRMTSMDADLKKANFEINQMKNLIAKLGDVVVNLQRTEEERQRQAAAAASKKGTKKKPGVPAKGAKKAVPAKKKK